MLWKKYEKFFFSSASKVSLRLAQWYICFFLFFSIQVPFPKSLLSPIKLIFVHVLLWSQSVIYFSKPGDIAPNAPATTGITITSFIPHILAVSSLSILYFSVFPTSLLFTRSFPGMLTSTILTSFLVWSITTISGHRDSILVSHWIVKSHSILYPFVLNNSIWLMLVPLLCSWKTMFFAVSNEHTLPMNIL